MFCVSAWFNLHQKYFTPPIMQIHRRHTDTEINIMVSDSGHLESLLNNQLIDLALIQQPKRPGHYRYLTLPSVWMVAVVCRNLLPNDDFEAFGQLAADSVAPQQRGRHV